MPPMRFAAAQLADRARASGAGTLSLAASQATATLRGPAAAPAACRDRSTAELRSRAGAGAGAAFTDVGQPGAERPEQASSTVIVPRRCDRASAIAASTAACGTLIDRPGEETAGNGLLEIQISSRRSWCSAGEGGMHGAPGSLPARIFARHAAQLAALAAGEIPIEHRQSSRRSGLRFLFSAGARSGRVSPRRGRRKTEPRCPPRTRRFAPRGAGSVPRRRSRRILEADRAVAGDHGGVRDRDGRRGPRCPGSGVPRAPATSAPWGP